MVMRVTAALVIEGAEHLCQQFLLNPEIIKKKKTVAVQKTIQWNLFQE